MELESFEFDFVIFNKSQWKFSLYFKQNTQQFYLKKYMYRESSITFVSYKFN